MHTQNVGVKSKRGYKTLINATDFLDLCALFKSQPLPLSIVYRKMIGQEDDWSVTVAVD